MKAWLWVILVFLSSPFFLWSAVPQTRVVDKDGVMSLSARMVLEDQLYSMAKTQQVDAYVVVLKNETVEEGARLCEQWQKEWVPSGLGGVFVYCIGPRQCCFRGTAETQESLGESRLRKIFTERFDNLLVDSSVDVEISTPVFRLLTALGEQRINYRMGAIEEAQRSTFKWKFIAGLALAFALLAWVFSISKVLRHITKGTKSGNIPPPGMAYGNPKKGSGSRRRSRRDQKSENESESDRY